MAWGDILAITYYSPSDACWFNPADGSKPCIPRKYEPADGENQFAPKSAYASLQPTELTYWWDFGGVPLTAATMPQYNAFHEAMAAGEGVLAKGSGDFTTRDPLEAPCLCGAEGGACRWFVPKALQPSSSAAGDGRSSWFESAACSSWLPTLSARPCRPPGAARAARRLAAGSAARAWPRHAKRGLKGLAPRPPRVRARR